MPCLAKIAVQDGAVNRQSNNQQETAMCGRFSKNKTEEAYSFDDLVAHVGLFFVSLSNTAPRKPCAKPNRMDWIRSYLAPFCQFVWYALCLWTGIASAFQRHEIFYTARNTVGCHETYENQSHIVCTWTRRQQMIFHRKFADF